MSFSAESPLTCRTDVVAAETEVLVADETGLIEVHIFRAPQHGFLRSGVRFSVTGPEVDAGLHPVRLAFDEAFQQVGLALGIQRAGRAAANAQAAVGAGIFLCRGIRG